MREVVDPVNPIELKKPFKELFSVVQRNGALQAYALQCGKLKDLYLLPLMVLASFIREPADVMTAATKHDHFSDQRVWLALYHRGQGW
ncbi:hypothetical protein [Salinisphaera sp. G21_0]|uniref:hypothetical protein n=1 Tax=Salinisphaera sp. G21_0 TaxID=2821094 RepID=UPI001ADA6BF4|nr:hypothetical protein [Salinisphaera sp. G21_0]MBO9484089.1 hypothetical protein [Salinisphaera sp. G21_0]